MILYFNCSFVDFDADEDTVIAESNNDSNNCVQLLFVYDNETTRLHI